MDIDREIREYHACRDWEDQAWADDMHERIRSMAKRALDEFANPPYPAEWWEALQWESARNMPYQPSQQQFQMAMLQCQNEMGPYDFIMGNPLAGLLGMTQQCQCCGR